MRACESGSVPGQHDATRFTSHQENNLPGNGDACFASPVTEPFVPVFTETCGILGRIYLISRSKTVWRLPSMPYAYRVLAVDDSPHVRILMTKLLKRFGFENVETAENGKVGLQKFATFKPDAVFLDGIMPEMDGLTVLRAIKAQSTTTIVVITSSLSEREKVLQFKESGADFYLMKPFEEAKFQEVAQKVVNVLDSRPKAS